MQKVEFSFSSLCLYSYKQIHMHVLARACRGHRFRLSIFLNKLSSVFFKTKSFIELVAHWLARLDGHQATSILLPILPLCWIYRCTHPWLACFMWVLKNYSGPDTFTWSTLFTAIFQLLKSTYLSPSEQWHCMTITFQTKSLLLQQD